MAAHSPEARKYRRDLDKLLAQVAVASGRQLAWSPTELLLLDQIMDAIDRRVDLAKCYAVADHADARVKLSSEQRLLEGHIERMTRRVTVELPKPVSRRSEKARHAANVRWQMDAARDAN